MELLQLKYFQSVAKYENVTKAAKELHISQPSLSITIKRLEDELSVPLFNRKGKHIELNPYGKLFLTHVDSILGRIDNAKSELLELYGEKNTHISLAATATIFLSGLLKEFLTINSDITMAQTINYQNTIIEKLKDRTIDFAITSPPIECSEVKSIELLEEEIVVVIPKDHKFSNLTQIYLKDLKHENFIELTENYSFKSSTKKLFEQAGFTPNVIFEGDLSIVAELVDLKSAIALSPLSLCLSTHNESYKILKLKDKNRTRKIAISYFRGRHLPDLAKNFVDFTINYYKTSWFTLENYAPIKENLNLDEVLASPEL